jgi:hypothetical protein
LIAGVWVANHYGGRNARASTVTSSALPTPSPAPAQVPVPNSPLLLATVGIPRALAAVDEPVKRPLVPPTRVRGVKARARASDVSLSVEGTLVLATHPWCTVSVDGVKRGPTPMRLALPAGAHVIRLQNPEFGIDHTTSMVIPANETIRRRIDFPTGGH